MTSTTPGWALAAGTSREVTRPRAMLLTARTAWSIPGGWLSAAYRASPLTFRTPSRRVSGCPIFEPCRTWAGAWARVWARVWTRLISGVMQGSGNGCERGGRKSRHALRRSRRGECQGAHQDSLCELDLELVVAGGFRVDQRRHRRAAERLGSRTGAFQNFLGCTGPPRFGGHAAKGEPRIADCALFDPQRRGGRYDGEGVGGALANFQIACMRREPVRLARQPQRDDQIARLEYTFPLGRVAGEPVKRLH